MGREPELDWNDLRFFCAAAEQGSLAAAARTLGVEHTTVGRRLNALEAALGTALVVRGPEGLSLTPIGRKLLPLVTDISSHVERARELVRAEKSRVRLAVPSGFSRLFAPELSRLAQLRPDLSLELLSGARPADLSRGEADLALRGAPLEDAELVAKKLCRLGWSLYGSRQYLARSPANPDPTDLSGHAVVGFDRSLARGPAAQWLDPRCEDARIALRSREMVDLLAATQSGAGLALLPCFLGDFETGLVRLTPAVLVSQPLSLVYRREARLSKEVRAVIRFVSEVIEQHAAALAG